MLMYQEDLAQNYDQGRRYLTSRFLVCSLQRVHVSLQKSYLNACFVAVPADLSYESHS